MEPYPTRYSLERIQQEASKIILPENTEPVMVSLDHDFFYPGSNAYPTDPDLHDELVLSGAVNWRIDEWFSKERARRSWQEHKGRLKSLGQDPRWWSQMAQTPAPESFLEHLRTWHTINKVYLGDAHLWGLVVACALYEKTKEPLHVIHYDAHHDCGYINYPGDTQIKSQTRASLGACSDDWIAVGLQAGIIGKLTIIYPDWRGVNEWFTDAPATMSHTLQDKVSITTYSEWVTRSHIVKESVCMYARSSAFVPPWSGADKKYLDLAHTLDPDHECLDCMNLMQIGSQNACEPRA